MRIGLFRRRYLSWGGGERFAHQFLESLAAAGHEVHLFCHAWRATAPGVRVHRVPSLGGGALGVLTWALIVPRLARRAGVDLVHSFDRTLGQDVFRAGEGCHREWLALRARGGASSWARLACAHCTARCCWSSARSPTNAPTGSG